MAAQTAPNMGVAGSYSVLAHTGVTNVPTTTVSGDVGTDTSTIGGGIVYLPPGTARNLVDSLAAQSAVDVARLALEAQGSGSTIPSQLGGSILTHGIYTVTAVSLLTGTLTLDGPGVFIFRTGGLTVATDARVNLINGADACNVFWRDTSDVTLGVRSAFAGTVIALNSISMLTNATLDGRLIAQNAAVTMDQNTITGPRCSTTTATTLSAGSITAGGTAFDTATLTGTNIGTAGGSVIYNIYSDSACIVLAGTAGTRTVTGGVIPNSDPFTFPSTGTYYWRASYAGDSLNQASANVCGAEVLTVTAAIASSLPATGLSPNRMTALPVQPANRAYASMGDLWLEIPKLGVQMNIVGVPQEGGEWDVSWLGKDAGWLQGSAFPTWSGNSVVAGHVWNADNTAGPFRYINTLWWGDKVIVHVWGAQYVYEVRSIRQVSPGNTGAMLKHEELSWITLVTCRGYNEATDSYNYRVLVRAVLVEVK